MPAGRPTLYREEYVEQIVEFCAGGMSIAAFAGEIDVCRDTILEWADTHPEFSVAVKRAKAKRANFWERRAIDVASTGGTGGQATMIIFGLKNHAPEDFSDKQVHEHGGTGGGPIMVVSGVPRSVE